MTELMVIGVLALIIFGPRQLPKLGRSLGETIKEFRGVAKTIQAEMDDES